MNCSHYNDLFDKVYKKTNIEYESVDTKCEELNCFIKVPPNTYPPKIDFEIYYYKGVKQKNIYILKFDKEGKICFSINNKILRITDIFIKPQMQNKGIMSKILSHLVYFIKNEYPTINYITLKSLASGIIAWYKLGFEFYNKTDKIIIKNILSLMINIKIKDLKEISKHKLKQINFF